MQLAYNEEHGIVPRGIIKTLDEVRLSTSVVDAKISDGSDVIFERDVATEELARFLEEEMLKEAKALNFEKAASLRDRLDEVRIQLAVEKQGFSKSKRKGWKGKRR